MKRGSVVACDAVDDTRRFMAERRRTTSNGPSASLSVLPSMAERCDATSITSVIDASVSAAYRQAQRAAALGYFAGRFSRTSKVSASASSSETVWSSPAAAHAAGRLPLRSARWKIAWGWPWLVTSLRGAGAPVSTFARRSSSRAGSLTVSFGQSTAMPHRSTLAGRGDPQVRGVRAGARRRPWLAGATGSPPQRRRSSGDRALLP